MSIIIALLVLGVLIVVHEAGHFIVAKWANVYVEKFAVGFGPKLLSKKIGETEYVLAAFPLGGYVKMYGEMNDDGDTPGNETYDPAKEGRSFKNKNGWQKAAIVFAGPFFNLLFAIVIFWGLFMTGIPSYSPTVGKVDNNSAAYKAGIMQGDIITHVNGKEITSWSELVQISEKNIDKELTLTLSNSKVITIPVTEKEIDDVFGDKDLIPYLGFELQVPPIIGDIVPGTPAENSGLMVKDRIISINNNQIHSWSDLSTYIKGNAGKEITFVVNRNGEEKSFKLVPEAKEFGKGEEKEVVGIAGISATDGDVVVNYGPIQALTLGLEKSYELSKMIYVGFVKLIQRAIPADSLGGPILIVQTAAKTADSGFAQLLIFMAAISINLAIFNLLPIPVLDGGQLAIIATEGIMGRPLGEKAIGAFQMFGILVIISLMIFAFYNDIMRIIN